MDAYDKAQEFIAREQSHPDAAIMATLIHALRNEGPFDLGALYRLTLDQFELALQVLEEDPEVSALVTRLEAAADRELAAGTVTLRWGREQIGIVKRAAALMGVPYQTYLKQVVFRQALDDIERTEAALARQSAGS